MKVLLNTTKLFLFNTTELVSFNTTELLSLTVEMVFKQYKGSPILKLMSVGSGAGPSP